MEVKRFDVFWVSFDPTVGSEIHKSRPALIISPDEANFILNTVIVAPITSAVKHYPTRLEIELLGKKGQIAFDQIRTVDKTRLKKKLATIDEALSKKVIDLLQLMFS
jgi:mRNA interferase MazF